MSQANYYSCSGVTSEGLSVCLQPWLFPSCLFITVVPLGLCFLFGWQPLSSGFLTVLFISVVRPRELVVIRHYRGSCLCFNHRSSLELQELVPHIPDFWVEIGICASIKVTSWCRAWLLACNKDILRPYISRVGFKCLAGMGMLASSLHWASSHLVSREEEATAWRGQCGLEGWKNVSGT